MDEDNPEPTNKRVKLGQEIEKPRDREGSSLIARGIPHAATEEVIREFFKDVTNNSTKSKATTNGVSVAN